MIITKCIAPVAVTPTRTHTPKSNKDLQDILNAVPQFAEGETLTLTRDLDLYPMEFMEIDGKPNVYIHPYKQIETDLSTCKAASNAKYANTCKALVEAVNNRLASDRMKAFPMACDTVELEIIGKDQDGKPLFGSDRYSKIALVKRGFIGKATAEKIALDKAMENASETDSYESVYKRVTGRSFKVFPLFPSDGAEEEEVEETAPAPAIRPKSKR